MKNACRNIVSINTLRGRLIKKHVISLLILTTIAALFTALTAACTNNSVRDSGRQLHSASLTSTGPQKQCGTLSYQQGSILDNTINGNAQQNVNCFLQAYQQCAPASIDFSVSTGAGINPGGFRDTPMKFGTKSQLSGEDESITNYTFSTQAQSSGCTLSESVSLDKGAPTQQTCVRVEQIGSKLLFVDCGTTDTITFPLIPTTPIQGVP